MGSYGSCLCLDKFMVFFYCYGHFMSAQAANTVAVINSITRGWDTGQLSYFTTASCTQVKCRSSSSACCTRVKCNCCCLDMFRQFWSDNLCCRQPSCMQFGVRTYFFAGSPYKLETTAIVPSSSLAHGHCPMRVSTHRRACKNKSNCNIYAVCSSHVVW